VVSWTLKKGPFFIGKTARIFDWPFPGTQR
jgi:hypothetical protein